MPKQRNPRPSRIRTPENADRICSLIAEGYSLRQVGVDIGCVPSVIIEWARTDDVFGERYARAMELRVERMADEIIEISDNSRNDWMEREEGGATDHEHIQRARLRVDARKWLMAKMMPKKYGDRVAVEHGGEVNVTHERAQAVERTLTDLFGGVGESAVESSDGGASIH